MTKKVAPLFVVAKKNDSSSVTEGEGGVSGLSAAATSDGGEQNAARQQPKSPFHPEKQLAFNSLSERDVREFGGLAPFLKRNPRKVKRIVNVYRLCRALIPNYLAAQGSDDNLDPYANPGSRLAGLLKTWVVLLEQWPVRMTWMLHILQDLEQLRQELPKPETTLWNFYSEIVEPFVYNVGLQELGSDAVAERYRRLFTLDDDPELFDLLLKTFEPTITIGDIGSLSYREKDKLVSYCINLNPAIRETLSHILSHRQDMTDPTWGVSTASNVVDQELKYMHPVLRVKRKRRGASSRIKGLDGERSRRLSAAQSPARHQEVESIQQMSSVPNRKSLARDASVDLKAAPRILESTENAADSDVGELETATTTSTHTDEKPLPSGDPQSFVLDNNDDVRVVKMDEASAIDDDDNEDDVHEQLVSPDGVSTEDDDDGDDTRGKMMRCPRGGTDGPSGAPPRRPVCTRTLLWRVGAVC